MKRIFQLLALVSFGLAIGSCDKSEPVQHKGQGESLSELRAFEFSSSLHSVSIEPLSSNTDEAANELRATLHFHGSNTGATTTLKAEDFGAGKREARWGVIYDGDKHHAVNCEEAVSVEPTTSPVKNTVYFKETTTGNTIQDAGIKMYCRTLTTLKNITKGFMVLEGNGGSGADVTKQYFRGTTDPNHRIEGLLTSNFQDDRHIPIMTKVEDFAEMTKPLGSNSVKFAPRGSLIGLNIKNKTGNNIIITHILVQKSGALDYSGYFDWGNVVDDKASFTAEYTTTATILEFPVYQSKTATDLGYTIANNNTEVPCFFVWGFQNPNKVGEDFQVKFRYKTTGGYERTTEVFNIHAPNSKLVGGTKQFDDGYSYNAILTLNDWTPLDFVAEAPAINKAGNGFITNHNLPPYNNNVGNIQNTNVGYYTWDEAMALFDGSKPFLADYFLPNRYQWRSIIPRKMVIYTSDTRSKKTFTETAQVGETLAQDYTSEFITVDEGGIFVTYALRFKGTDWVSAWRYAYATTAKEKFVIKCLSLKDKPNVNSLDLEQDIVNPSLFTTNACSVRTFPMYGRLFDDGLIKGIGGVAAFWSSTPEGNYDAWTPEFFGYVVYETRTGKVDRHPVRPFRRL